MQRLLIIGCGMATARLLETLVAGRHGYQIEVVGAEPSAAYNRVLLSSLLAGDKNESDLALLSERWYASHNITLALGESVVALDVNRRIAITDKQRQIHWDKVVIATGSRARIPGFSGSEQAGLVSFRDKADLAQLQQAAKHHARAVVLGGGLLGLEAAYGLLSLGMQVTVVHRQAWLLNRQLDQEGGLLLQSQLEAMGISFRLGLETVRWHNDTRQLELADGTALEAGLVVAATGTIPNAELARAAGIECDKGIVVNAAMVTSAANVYAVGECCQHGQQCYGLVAPVQEQAQVLGRQLCGDLQATYQYQDTAVHLKIAGIAMVASGDLHGTGTQDQVFRDPVQGTYRRLALCDNRVSGFVLIGNKQHAPWYQQLLETRTDIRPFRPWLMFGDQNPTQAVQIFSEVKYAGQ